jgi:EAL domain-containing protein (putative c-di-GMP-specific phosphodiesterase class I)
MRWQHPVYGAIPPTTFIPLAEETGLIVPLGEWAIRRACEIAARLPADVHIAVNVSGLQFERPGLVACVAQALAQTGIVPGQLELEITESVLMSEDEQVMRTVGLLRELGVRTALDDFGTGYASFAYLRRFPFDRVKLDRGFVRGLPGERTSRAIVAAMAVLAAQLGATITAEGVENEDQLACLRELGCSDVQGYLIGEPGPDPAVWLTPDRAVSRA